MSEVIFTGLYGMREDRRNEYVDDIPAKVRELLAKGVRIDVKGSASTVRPLLTELMSFPPPEEQETKFVNRYHFKTMGGVSKPFISLEKASDHYNKYCARLNYPWGLEIITNEVEVQA